MSWARIELRDGKSFFHPREPVEGQVSWSLERVPASVELRLFWYTQGKGDRDVGVVENIPLADPAAEDRRTFSLDLPDGPYSFSGKLVSLVWAVEVVIQPGDLTDSVNFTMSPTGEELRLGSGRRAADPGA